MVRMFDDRHLLTLVLRHGQARQTQWRKIQSNPYGIDYPSNVERVSLLEEGMELLIMLWSKHSTTFEGRHFKVKDAALLKKQTEHNSIPITIAAKEDRTIRIAARYAHVWECSYLTPEQFI
jgi:alkanesulfonate monooxygenase SsuD/methylene tetrahydromethanopterin reductase-like flavin-dependent oxidoreductase (luciferase family)